MRPGLNGTVWQMNGSESRVRSATAVTVSAWSGNARAFGLAVAVTWTVMIPGGT